MTARYGNPRRRKGVPPIFVFGSNEAGIHGAGSAMEALRKYYAIWGQGEGIQGYAYGIPTKNGALKTLPLAEIKVYVDRFIRFAAKSPTLKFECVKIGCGLAGYREEQIAPLFKDAPENVILPKGWRELCATL